MLAHGPEQYRGEIGLRLEFGDEVGNPFLQGFIPRPALLARRVQRVELFWGEHRASHRNHDGPPLA